MHAPGALSLCTDYHVCFINGVMQTLLKIAQSCIFTAEIELLDLKIYPASGGFAPLTLHQGLCPWTPLGALPQTPVIGSYSMCSPWPSPPLSKIPNTPLHTIVILYQTVRISLFLTVLGDLFRVAPKKIFLGSLALAMFCSAVPN